MSTRPRPLLILGLDGATAQAADRDRPEQQGQPEDHEPVQEDGTAIELQRAPGRYDGEAKIGLK